MKNKQPKIVLVKTGELKDITKATPNQISSYLSDINLKRRVLDKQEKAIKRYVQDNRKLEFNEEGFVMFGEHKISQTGRLKFDRKRFEKEGTKEEKEIIRKAEQIQNRYLTKTMFLKWI